LQPWAAIVIGAAAGLLCYGAVHLKDIFHYDDSLYVVGVHMVGGVEGVVLTGVFASLAVNAAGEAGGWTQLGRQAVLARRDRLPVRHDLDHLVGHRPHRGAAGESGR
jgi:Amt family ammonium transporter